MEALVSYYLVSSLYVSSLYKVEFCLPHPSFPRYDIKGCEVSRWVEPAPEGSPLVLVLKDLNFQGKTNNLGEPRGRSLPALPPFRVKLEGCPWHCSLPESSRAQILESGRES